MVGREEVTTRDDDRVTLRLFSGGICSLSGSSAELFKDDSGSSAVSLMSRFSVVFGLRRESLGTIANGSGLAISSRPLSSISIWRTRFLILISFAVRGYERFFPMTEAGLKLDAANESDSEDVWVRKEEQPSAVVNVDNRLGTLTAEDPEGKETRRLGTN